MFYMFLFLAGSAGGFFSGLLGIGGGILLFPVLYYLPQALGFESIPVKHITGLTMVQGFAASLTAMVFHKREKLVNRSLALTFGLSLSFSSFTGSFFSKEVPDKYLLFIFGILAFIASLLMFLPRDYARDNLTEEKVLFNRPAAIIIGVVTGFLIGLVGQGGAFIIIPLLLYVLKIPLRVAFGSTLAIGMFSAAAGLLGKAATTQIPFNMAAALLPGAIMSARLGSIISKKTRAHSLRWLLALLISATAAKVWYDIFKP
jgi:uncharacterized membrane protein YfcA